MPGFSDVQMTLTSAKLSAAAAGQGSKIPFLTNTSWEGDAKSGLVKITSVGKATLKTFTPGTALTLGTGGGAQYDLKLDQNTYFADVLYDTVKVSDGYVAKYCEKAAAQMQLAHDAYILNTVAGGFTSNKITGASDAAISVNAGNILALIGQCSDALRAQDALMENSFICIPGAWYSLVTEAASGKQFPVSSDSYFAAGLVPKIHGLNVIESNAYTITSNTAKVFFGHPDAIASAAYAHDLVQMDLGAAGFGTLSKALFEFGGKIVEESMGGYIKLVRS